MQFSSSSAQQALSTLGARLRELRRDAGLTGRELARRAGWHASKVSKIEYARQAPSAKDITVWCGLCNADAHAVDLIASLHAVQGMFVEWRRLNRSGLLQEQRRRQAVWQRASRYRGYASWVMPGPVQIADYVRVVLTAIRNRRELAHDDIEAAVAARIDRQQLLRQPDRRLAILVEESVLHNSIGGPDVMAAQLGHLLAVGIMPTVSLGVLPQKADRSVTQPYEIAQYVKVFGMLSEQATYGAQARALIANAIAAAGEAP